MTLADVDDHVAGEDDVLRRFLSGGVSTVETASLWILEMADQWESNGPIRMFGVRDASSGALCGTVDAHLQQAGLRPGVANITYGLHARYRGRGYASRAVSLMLGYLIEETTADTAVIQVDRENEASSRLAVRLGFRSVGMRVTAQGELLRTFIRRLREPES